MESRPHHSSEQPGTEGAEGAEPVVCAHCGARAEGAEPTWTCSVESGTRRYFCDDCARANLRSIEGRLDSTWW